MGEKQQNPYTAYVGIDWADSKHDVCIQPAGENVREFDVIAHRVEVIDQWVYDLHQRFGGLIAVAIELSKGPIISALQKYDFIVIYPIHPSTLAKYRQTFKPSRAKDDPTDAEFAVDLLMRHPESFKPLKPQSSEIRALATLVEQRRQLVNEKIRITNRLRAALKQYYPQALDWFDHIDTRMFCDFLERWPTLIQVKRARAATLEKFFGEYNMRRPGVLKRRLASIKTSAPLTTDKAIIVPYRLQALVLVRQLRVMLQSIKEFDEEIEKIACKHADYYLFSPLPGAGPSLAPRLLVAFGEQRERFSSAEDLQKYSGIAPVTERSGKKEWVHWRWQCSTFLRQTFVARPNMGKRSSGQYSSLSIFSAIGSSCSRANFSAAA
jgi:transposase